MIAAAYAEIAELKIINATADERIARLTSIVAMLQRAQYGTRSERLRHDPLDDKQIAFVFDEIETGIEEIKAGLEARDRNGAAARPSRPRKGFAPHLEPIEQVIEPEAPADCVGLEAIRIGEDVAFGQNASAPSSPSCSLCWIGNCRACRANPNWLRSSATP